MRVGYRRVAAAGFAAVCSAMLFSVLTPGPANAAGAASQAAASPEARVPIKNRWAIGYYPWYTSYDVAPSAFPYSKLTHVAIGDVLVAADGCCVLPPGADAVWATYAADVVRLAHAAGKKVIVQLGGANNAPDGWQNGTSSPEATDVLARQMIAFTQALGADGMDLDWEQQVDLVAEGRIAKRIKELWPAAIVMMAVSPFDEDLSWVPSVAPYVDRVNAMTYIGVGNWGGWDGPWHQGALFGDGPGHPLSVDRKARALIAAGMPAAKTGIGLGLFGTAYGDANGDGNCPSAPSSGWGGEWGAWFADYQLQLGQIDALYANSMTRQFDPVAKVPYLYAAAPGAGGEADGWPPKLCYITYEDEASATAKARYVIDNGLGAVIMWAVPQDKRANGGFPVVNALWTELRKRR